MAENTYIDVTQLVHWDRKLTGIPRVMHELAVRFHDDAKNVLFVSWVKEVNAYCLVDYEQSVINRGNGIVYLSGDTHPSAQTESTGTSHRTRSLDVSIYLKKAGKRLLSSYPSLHDKLGGAVARRKSQTYTQVHLGKKDAVFIGWGEWWDDNFLQMLEKSRQSGAKISTVIHDIGPMVTPHLSGHSSESLANYCRRIVPICEVVLVNSHYTKKSLSEWLTLNELKVPDIEIFVLGDDFEHSESEAPSDPAFRSSGLKGGDYAMTVGTIELKKNHLLLYYVYYLAKERGIDLPKIVIVGRKGWSSDMIISMMQNDPVLSEKFVFLFDTSDEELSWLYEHAKYSVFPSFYEGWGIPVAESLYRHVPVISSRASSLAEVGGELVERFSPGSSDECLALMQKMNDRQYYDAMKARVSSYVPATWDGTYEKAKDALKTKGMIND